MTTRTLNSDFSSTKVQVELSGNMLKQLLKSGLLHVDDCKCLNANAKKVLWQALLVTSTDRKSYPKSCLLA